MHAPSRHMSMWWCYVSVAIGKSAWPHVSETSMESLFDLRYFTSNFIDTTRAAVSTFLSVCTVYAIVFYVHVYATKAPEKWATATFLHSTRVQGRVTSLAGRVTITCCGRHGVCPCRPADQWQGRSLRSHHAITCTLIASPNCWLKSLKRWL